MCCLIGEAEEIVGRLALVRKKKACGQMRSTTIRSAARTGQRMACITRPVMAKSGQQRSGCQMKAVKGGQVAKGAPPSRWQPV
jgi:hypothetical protein